MVLDEIQRLVWQAPRTSHQMSNGLIAWTENSEGSWWEGLVYARIGELVWQLVINCFVGMEERSSTWAAGDQNSPSFNQVRANPMPCWPSKGVVGACFAVDLLLSLLFQSYGEGSHYNEHDGLSSPFLGTGISGEFYQCLVGWSQSRWCRNYPMGCLKVAQGRWAHFWPHQIDSLF